MSMIRLAAAALLIATPGYAQTPGDPFPNPIETSNDVIVVGFQEFAALPDIDGSAARPMLLVDEPGTARLFVNDMRGPIYGVTYDGEVTLYLDINDARWRVPVESSGRERGMQSFAFHPQFNQPGTAGYGRFYTWTDTQDKDPEPDFVSGGGQDSHDTVLLEWAALDPSAPTYDGGLPRHVLRVEQPFGNHNGGHIAFNPTSSPRNLDFGRLYVGVADGGSGGDPMDLAQNLGSLFGKLIRIQPLGSNSVNGRYGVPAENPYAADGNEQTLGEIYASGVRNPQRFGWDSANENLFLADIGQNIVEYLSLVTEGADLGWNSWEGSYRFISRQAVDLSDPRGEPGITYPVAEYGQLDPLLQRQSAITGVVAYRDRRIPQLEDMVLFGDFPSGEVFYVPADDLPQGGQNGIRRILFRDGGQTSTLLDLVQAKNSEQGRERATRVDLRFGTGPEGRVFVLNKQDGVIRELVR
ncbi:MAG: PQQ-dependent sugar dehydrogenase [Gemmatimonadota bacterium]|nr:PQQ-dependent sugar dehydrogenase [Gemmatimonadota bacterium]